MKITFVVNSFSRQPTGGLKIIYQYANHFVERGHTVTIVFCLSNPVAKFEGKVPYGITEWSNVVSAGQTGKKGIQDGNE